MIQYRSTFFALTLMSLFCLPFLGCGGNSTDVASSGTTPTAASDHDDHDHEAGDDGHDHPAHGTRGGHMVELSDGSEVEVAFDEEMDTFTVYANDPDKVSKVEMVTKIAGNDTPYTFDKSEAADAEGSFALASPELSTAAKMGEGVDIELVITSEEGALTGDFELHQH